MKIVHYHVWLTVYETHHDSGGRPLGFPVRGPMGQGHPQWFLVES